MVNCNPETVSTDYDTSDRLYFEPLTEEYVLDVCDSRAAGRRRHPVRRPDAAEARACARRTPAIRSSARRSRPIDLAEDRERFAGLLDELGIRCPAWGIAESAAEAVAIAERIGYPVLVRPSYVLGGRAMRVCYRPGAGARGVRGGPARLDARRPLPRGCARDRRRRALRRTDTFVGGGDGARRGGRRPLRRLVLRAAGAVARRGPATRRSRSSSSKLAPALGVVGLVNVQLAVVDGEISVMEANPRASRTVPFASKATGVNLVEAACRVMAGAAVVRSGPVPGTVPANGQRQSCGFSVPALPRLRSRAGAGDAGDGRGDGLSG